MHTEKQEIFDRYAESIDSEKIKLGQGNLEIMDWEEFLLAFRYSRISLPDTINAIFAACDLVQKEQQKRIIDSMNWDRCKNKGSECRTDKHELPILSENNLIK